MRIINLTRELVSIYSEEGQLLQQLEPTHPTVLLEEIVTVLPSIGDIPVRRVTQGHIINLPQPARNVLYLVPRDIFFVARRLDVVAPGPIIRDALGRIKGHVGLTALLPH